MLTPLRALKSLWMSLQELRAAYPNLYFNLCFHISSYTMVKSFHDFSTLLCSNLPFVCNATYSSPSPLTSNATREGLKKRQCNESIPSESCLAVISAQSGR